MSYKITRLLEHGGNIKEFHLQRADGGLLPDWQAGAHIVLGFTDAAGQRYQNHYSLIGPPGPAHTYRIAVQREANGHGGSRCLHDEYGVGSGVEVSGPFNSFPLQAATPAGGRILLVAGGIGVTPLVSMAHALDARGASYTLHYLARSQQQLLRLEELQALPHGSVQQHLSQQAGRVDLAALLGAYQAGDQCYACGPASLLQGLAAAGTLQGWPAAALHFESFGARTGAQDATLTVELALSQMTLEVAPGSSILDALIAHDVLVSYDCQRGECGSCYTTVSAGQPVHRDICLTAAMRAQGMCTCVSWASSGRLVLDL